VAKERARDVPGALKILDDLATRYPLHLGIHLYRLQLARRSGVEAAAGLYDPPPPGVDPERAAVLVALARTPEEDVTGRMAILEAASVREPANPFWLLAVADVRLAAHDAVVRRAEEEHALGRIQESAQSFAEAARLVEEARRDAETALQYDANLAEAHLLLGFLWTRKADLLPQRERRDEMRLAAEYHYDEALRLDPANLAARINLAENLLYFGRYPAADDQLEKAVRIAPEEPLVWINMGFSAYSTGRLEKALDCYAEAMRLEPGNGRVRAAYADVLRRVDRADEAVKELEQARRDATGDRELEADIAFKLGTIHEYEKRYALAVKEYERYIELGGRDAAKAKSRIRHIYETAFE
jgi:tetratricopeptide (TPR) repeat protein